MGANATILPENPVYEGKASILSGSGKFIQLGDPAGFVKAIYLLVEGGSMPLYLPMGQDALGKAKRKMESLGKEISEAAPWSVDLVYDDMNGHRAKL